jgi:Thioredoxin
VALVPGVMTAPPLALTWAGGSLIFAGFVVMLFFVLVFGYYTRRGSGISQTPYRRAGAPPEAPSELSHDISQEVRNWQRGTAGHHRHRPEADREPVEASVAEALRHWRTRSSGAAALDPPAGQDDHVWGPDSQRIVAVYLDLASEPCRSAWPLLQQVAAEQRLRIAVRHLPLADVHPMALPAAETLEAASAQGRFFELLGRLCDEGVRSEVALQELAERVVGDPERLRAEVREGRYRAKVIEHIRQATASGVHAVPELYIDGTRYDGVLARDVLTRALAPSA